MMARFYRIVQKLLLFSVLTLTPLLGIATSDHHVHYKIKGLSEPALDNVKNRLKAVEENYPDPLDPQTAQLIYQNGPQQIKKALAPYGYFTPTITSQGLEALPDQQWRATYSVDPGPAVIIGKFAYKITGAGVAKYDKLQQDLPIKVGDQFNSDTYEKLKTTLKDIAAEQGFLGSKFLENEIRIDLKTNRAFITLHFDTGPQYYFGDVIFSKSPLADTFLQRFVKFNPGEPYSSSGLLQLQKELNNTIYFNSVSIHPQESEHEGLYVPIEVYLDPRKARQYDLGIGVGTDTGVRGTATMVWRHLTETGHYLRTSLQGSQIDSNAELRYVIPGKDPVTEQYYFGASVLHEQPNDNRGETQKLTVGRIDHPHGWKRAITLNYQWDYYSIRHLPYEKTRLLLPTINLSKTRVDDLLFPQKGYKITLNLNGASRVLASDSSFAQGEVVANLIANPFTESRLLLRGDIGYTAVNDLNKVPLSLQFFAGGAQSVRGYTYQELGPGRYLLTSSVELQYPVKGKWYLATFVDAGNAVNSLSNPKQKALGRPHSNINLNELLKYSAGLGVMYASPVGPIEVTLAKPLSDPGKPIRLQFTMGSNL